jgi:hypothetical protein
LGCRLAQVPLIYLEYRLSLLPRLRQ